MWPLGTYARFLQKIKGQELFGEKVNYFGVLFCDVRQSNAKEYILNYLNLFNQRSGKYIDFYIPGYIHADEYFEKKSRNTIQLGTQKYVFDLYRYNEFCERFEIDFGVSFPFSATLVLLEYTTGHFSTARKLVFELEYSENGIKASGTLFLIFSNVQKKAKWKRV